MEPVTEIIIGASGHPVRTIGSTLGRQIIRGLPGSLRRRK